MASSAMVADDSTWVIYFYTDGAANTSQVIGRATAPGPQGPWTADPEPVLQPGGPGAWDDIQVTRPSVVRTKTGYVMYYEGLGDLHDFMVGMASSTDGVHWTKYNDPSTTTQPFVESDPVIQPTTDPNKWDAYGVGHPHVQITPDGWVMLYRGGGLGERNTGPGDRHQPRQAALGYIRHRPRSARRNHPVWRGRASARTSSCATRCRGSYQAI
jgi:hypothetical protein